MDTSFLKQNLKKIVGQRNIFLVFSLVLSLCVVLLSCLLLGKKERIVILPTSGGTFWVEGEKVSQGYAEKMGIFLSDMLLNRSPADVDRRNEILLEHVDPSSFHELRKLLLLERDGIVKADQSFFFQPQMSFASNDSFVIEGESFLLVGKEGKAMQKGRKKYTLRFSCKNGRLFLKSISKEDV